ncbi:hydrolase [Microbacterium sp. KKR3/1]|uniref:hydrolase n=1 Tax=Microbacterium sp. KKR3/1 TaxID=2904241 RepID=UPI001E3EE938|nr:hydrolase [Microbacterium sp. KKR3/1]MCE0510088.1 hydrolase [Microbacterium sp. KKR3/1]
MHAATFFDGVGWREGVVELVDGRVRLSDGHSDADLPRLDGVVLGGFTDHHVHLQLVDHSQLSGSRLGRVVDLGGNPDVLRRLARGGINNAPPTRDSGTFSIPHPRALVVEFAGAFVAAPGGYPSDREWAPEGSVREVADERAAADVVAEMAATGASCLKVTSNSTAGPVFSDDLFRTIVGIAASHSLPVVAHAEGPGEAQRVVALGAARLAHAPFTERLDDEEIARQAASTSWISTLAIHDGRARAIAIAIDNVRRFHAAGGTVLYGTDLGNGPMPNDLNAREIAALREAGLHSDALLHALSPMDPLAPSATLLFLPGASPATADPLAARPLIPADLKV